MYSVVAPDLRDAGNPRQPRDRPCRPRGGRTLPLSFIAVCAEFCCVSAGALALRGMDGLGRAREGEAEEVRER